MKKWIAALLSVLMIMSMVTSTAVFAQEKPEAEQVIDIDVIDADTVPDADSYTIVDDGELLLEVERIKEIGVTAALDDVTTNEFYTADFVLPDSNYQVFLTGLTQDNVDEIRQAIIESYSEGADFELKNLGFVDAEKTWAEDGDENMCWAASTSNLLMYTGWAAQAGFNSTDDLFETFIDSFTDEGGNVEYATGWFFNGMTPLDGAQPTAGTGRYLPQYNYPDVVKSFNLYENCTQQLNILYDRLQNGYGVSLNVDIYGNTGYESSHAITLWGFVTDTRYPKTSEQFYKNIIITDSDSDKYAVRAAKDRRDADDVMSVCTLEAIHQDAVNSYMFHISNQQIALLAEAKTMAPFSDAIPHETSSDATLDPINSPDIDLDPFVLTDDPEVDQTITVFEPDVPIYFQPHMMNIAGENYYGPLNLSVSVSDSQGNELFQKNFILNRNKTIVPFRGMVFKTESIDRTLPVGDYTITASFNMDHSISEAYFYNNTRSIDFKVREKYLLGDVDADNVVSGLDATGIQRILAKLVNPPDEKAVVRGDINESDELDMLDVTIIQRYLAHHSVLYSVGESRFYD